MTDEGGVTRRRAWIAGGAVLAMAMAVVGIVLVARHDDEPSTVTPDVAPPSPTPVIAPLTGLQTDEPIRPALMVKIDDVDAARPQDGLLAADVIFEELVEGGLTRLGAVYSSTVPDLVGPIRSVRQTDLRLAPLLGKPGLVFSGGAVPVLAEVTEAAQVGTIVPISPLRGDATFFRRDDKVAPHDLYARASTLWDAATAATPPDALFAFGAVGSALPVSAFSLMFPSAEVAYRWQPATAAWVRSQNGRDQFDAARPEAPFEVANVVVLHVAYQPSATNEASPEASLDGGDGWVFRDGVGTACSWSTAPAPAPRIELRTPQGDVCRLEPGRTVIELSPTPPVIG